MYVRVCNFLFGINNFSFVFPFLFRASIKGKFDRGKFSKSREIEQYII